MRSQVSTKGESGEASQRRQHIDGLLEEGHRHEEGPPTRGKRMQMATKID